MEPSGGHDSHPVIRRGHPTRVPLLCAGKQNPNQGNLGRHSESGVGGSVSLHKTRPVPGLQFYLFDQKQHHQQQKKPTVNHKRNQNLLSLVGKKHKQSASNIKGLGLCGKRHFWPLLWASSAAAPGSWPGSEEGGYFTQCTESQSKCYKLLLWKKMFIKQF